MNCYAYLIAERTSWSLPHQKLAEVSSDTVRRKGISFQDLKAIRSGTSKATNRTRTNVQTDQLQITKPNIKAAKDSKKVRFVLWTCRREKNGHRYTAVRFSGVVAMQMQTTAASNKRPKGALATARVIYC